MRAFIAADKKVLFAADIFKKIYKVFKAMSPKRSRTRDLVVLKDSSSVVFQDFNAFAEAMQLSIHPTYF